MLRRLNIAVAVGRASPLMALRKCATETSATDGAAPSVSKEKLEALQKQLRNAEEEVKKLTSECLYKAASCENLRREMQEKKKKTAEEAVEAFARDMLEVCDALQVVSQKADEYSQQNTSMSPKHASVLAGVKLTHNVALKTLKRFGVAKAPTEVGKPFDGKCEERLYTVPSTPEVKDGCIAEVVKDGFTLNGSLLRKAQVAVGEDPER